MISLKPFFAPGTVSAQNPTALASVGCIKFTAVSGTVKVNFDDAGEITVSTGDTYQAPFPLVFEKIVLTADAGGTASFVRGLGTFGGGGSGGGYTTGTGSPEGVVSAAAGATYYDTSAPSYWLKASGGGTTGWIQLI